MRTNAILAGLALMLGLAAPVAAVAAEPPDMSPAADEGTGSGGNRPGMQPVRRPSRAWHPERSAYNKSTGVDVERGTKVHRRG